MIEYTVGFLYSVDRVLLIQKLHPDWQRGLWNGIGGKIKPEENAIAGMIREFEEEAGRHIEDWQPFARVTCPTIVLHFFRAFTGDFVGCRSMTKERVAPFTIRDLPNMVEPANWLCIAGADKRVHFGDIAYLADRSKETIT